MNLWMGVHLPWLIRDVPYPRWSASAPLLAGVVMQQDRVCAITPAAATLGARLGMRRAGVLALNAGIVLREREPEGEAALLHEAALVLLRYTPELCLAASHTLLLNLGPSLSLFGGPRALSRQVRADIQRLAAMPRLSLAPTAQGAWLLACHAQGGPRRALRAATLARRLQPLPCALLPAAQPHQAWLHAIGCHTLGALQSLPRAGLHRRCGPALLDTLDRAWGHAPDPRPWFEPPLTFEARLEPPEAIIHTEAVLACAQRLFVSLTGWLAARQQAVTGLMLTLSHTGRRASATQHPPTLVPLALADPTWQAEHPLRLLAEHLARTVLPAPVVDITLSISQLAPRPTVSNRLFTDPGGEPADHQRLLELLTARLGPDRVLQPEACADHRPEAAHHWAAATGALPAATVHDSAVSNATALALPDPATRPAWLLPAPLPLSTDGMRPLYEGTPLQIVHGPERLESNWWSTTPAARDYFVARGPDQALFWVYRERTRQDARWFLHGLFG